MTRITENDVMLNNENNDFPLSKIWHESWKMMLCLEWFAKVLWLSWITFFVLISLIRNHINAKNDIPLSIKMTRITENNVIEKNDITLPKKMIRITENDIMLINEK